MPTAFDLQFASAFRGMLRHHGETVIYKPRDGVSRPITALVTRREIMPLEPVNNGVAPQVMLEALDDPEDEDFGGISAEQLKTGHDYVRLAWKQGGPVEDKCIVERIPSDGGVIRVEIR